MTTDLQALSPEDVFEQLKKGAKSPRTERSLTIIHGICKEQQERGSIDFSIGTIGKLSENRGGPRAQPIRNAAGAAYRTLIEAWARHAEGRTRKPPLLKVGGLNEDVLALISDPVARVLVQSIISENKKLKYENQVLKVAAKEKVVIQLSDTTKHTGDAVEVVNPLNCLLEQERTALRSAISNDTMRLHGWRIHEQSGAVTKGPLPIFSAGFVTAIKKILDELNGG
jgi:hypothetical protein